MYIHTKTILRQQENCKGALNYETVLISNVFSLPLQPCLLYNLMVEPLFFLISPVPVMTSVGPNTMRRKKNSKHIAENVRVFGVFLYARATVEYIVEGSVCNLLI